MTQKIYFNGFGYYVPSKILANTDMQHFADTNDEWIRARTGIIERHIAAPGECNSDMSVQASKMALSSVGMDASEITAILCATATPDSIVPSTATRVQQKLGIQQVMAFDFNAACSGFIYGLQIAQGLLEVNPESKILLIGSEILTSRINWQDRSTSVLFGDGVGAVIMSTKKYAPQNPTLFSPNALLEGVLCSADGSVGDLLVADGGCSGHPYELGDKVGAEFFIKMNGREIYKHAVRNMPEICNRLMDGLGYTIQDIDVLIPHQANLRIIEAVGERLHMPAEKVFINIHKYGNTSAASIPLALGEALEQQFIKPGMRALLVTFGGGITWGAAILKF
ncbi:MAG: ketoacyl-ACP synthase III [Deltaproteobacteria bacterium]|jgi:3-oxoacyl-[acyl-carrier-protein] synthase-3|nr:ketoacyl-ACP synthase III [Deltaproteobacteria bacterium]